MCCMTNMKARPWSFGTNKAFTRIKALGFFGTVRLTEEFSYIIFEIWWFSVQEKPIRSHFLLMVSFLGLMRFISKVVE